MPSRMLELHCSSRCAHASCVSKQSCNISSHALYSCWAMHGQVTPQKRAHSTKSRNSVLKDSIFQAGGNQPAAEAHVIFNLSVDAGMQQAEDLQPTRHNVHSSETHCATQSVITAPEASQMCSAISSARQLEEVKSSIATDEELIASPVLPDPQHEELPSTSGSDATKYHSCQEQTVAGQSSHADDSECEQSSPSISEAVSHDIGKASRLPIASGAAVCHHIAAALGFAEDVHMVPEAPAGQTEAQGEAYAVPFAELPSTAGQPQPPQGTGQRDSMLAQQTGHEKAACPSRDVVSAGTAEQHSIHPLSLEWLRGVPEDAAREYLMGIFGEPAHVLI